MKKTFFTTAAQRVFLLLLIVLCASCSTTRHIRPHAASFYDDNIRDFTVETLSNGIPLIFKQHAGKTAWVGLLINGGVSLYPPEKSGLEDITLSVMLHGSEKYSYNELQRLQFDKSFSLNATAGKDYALVSTRFINRDTETAIEVLADSLLHPLLSADAFEKIMAENKEYLQRTLSNPSGVLGQELSKSAFSNHPYATSAMLTEESSASITLEDVKAHYSTLLNANRLAFVVVGDFTGSAQKDMRALLDSYFGTLEQADYTMPDIPVAEVSEGAVYAPCTVAADTGYIAGYFACPERTSDDYVAFAIALMYLDDIMFAQVREQHGAVYSIGSGVFGGRQLLGALSIYKATEKDQLKHYVYDAIESFPTEDEIAKTLDQYKNKYITTLFSNSQTITGVAGNVVASLAYYNSPTQYLNRATQVQAVTAEDVARVYRRYIARSAERAENGNVNPICWVIVSGEETLHQFAF